MSTISYGLAAMVSGFVWYNPCHSLNVLEVRQASHYSYHLHHIHNFLHGCTRDSGEMHLHPLAHNKKPLKSI